MIEVVRNLLKNNASKFSFCNYEKSFRYVAEKFQKDLYDRRQIDNKIRLDWRSISKYTRRFFTWKKGIITDFPASGKINKQCCNKSVWRRIRICRCIGKVVRLAQALILRFCLAWKLELSQWWNLLKFWNTVTVTNCRNMRMTIIF